MILGIGSDLVDIRRIGRLLALYGRKFETRIFTEVEQEKARLRAALNDFSNTGKHIDQEDARLSSEISVNDAHKESKGIVLPSFGAYVPFVVSHYAKRFAAKEACVKALGLGISAGITFKDIGVENSAAGQPMLVLQGAAQSRLLAMVPDGFSPSIHLSLTDEPPYALAFVVISAVALT